ncbi:hypothetical protein TNCV_2247381 [Trichonephila clavipes]|nr:hypothetical protein TNCV_2247381 [Trichonephila clavipes]
MVKVSDHGRHVMSSSPVPPKTCRVGQRYTLNLSRTEKSSRLCDMAIVSRIPSVWMKHGQHEVTYCLIETNPLGNQNGIPMKKWHEATHLLMIDVHCTSLDAPAFTASSRKPIALITTVTVLGAADDVDSCPANKPYS